MKDINVLKRTPDVPVNVIYMANEDGKNAQDEIYIPEANMRNVSVSLPT